MLAETFDSIATAVRQVWRHWRSVLLLIVIYAALLANLYFLVVIKEASISQVALTFALALAAPLLFFALQAIAFGWTVEHNSGSRLKKSLVDMARLILISLPLVALVVLAIYLLGKLQARLGVGINTPGDVQLPLVFADAAQSQTLKQPVNWPLASLATVRYLLFGVIVPLACIQLWIATVHDGLRMALRRASSEFCRAFNPQSLLVYVSGFVVFGLVPYLLLFKAVSTKHAWLEIVLFAARLGGVFALTLLGWVITVTALAHLRARSKNSFAGQES